MKLTLIRHAESEANAGYATSDPADICLTELGKRQAIELAQQFNEPPDLILVTSYKRTQQTAQPLIEKFPLTPVEVWPLHEFTFLSPASCKNTTVQDRLPMVQQYWERCDPFFVHGKGAESFHEFMFRVGKCLADLRILHNNSVVMFTHGYVIRLIHQVIGSVENLTPDQVMIRVKNYTGNLPLHNCSINGFHFGDSAVNARCNL